MIVTRLRCSISARHLSRRCSRFQKSAAQRKLSEQPQHSRRNQAGIAAKIALRALASSRSRAASHALRAEDESARAWARLARRLDDERARSSLAMC